MKQRSVITAHKALRYGQLKVEKQFGTQYECQIRAHAYKLQRIEKAFL